MDGWPTIADLCDGVNNSEIDTGAGGQFHFTSTGFRKWIGNDLVNWNINWKVNGISQLQVGFLFIPWY